MLVDEKGLQHRRHEQYREHAAHRLGNVVVDAWLPVVVSGLPGPELSPTIATHP